MSAERLTVLYVPSPSGHGPYRSLTRVEQSARDALRAAFTVLEPEVPASAPPADWQEALAGLGGFDAAVDVGGSLRHVEAAPRAPTIVLPLGNLPVGASLLWQRRSRLKSTDVLAVNCTADRAIVDAVLGGTGPRAELLPLGVDLARFRPRGEAARRATRAALGISEGAFLLVYAGRISAQKNPLGLLLLLRALVPRLPGAILVLAGSFDDIPHPVAPGDAAGMERRLEDLVRRWGLEERVRFTGPLGDEDLAALLAAADALVTLSLHSNENFGFAPVEAMAAGIPAAVSHWGGLGDTVVHGETGWFAETWMTDRGARVLGRQLVAPLLRLASDPGLRERMGRAARARAESCYGLDSFAARLAAIVREAVRRARTEKPRPGSTFRFHAQARQLHLAWLHRAVRGPRASRSWLDPEPFRWFQRHYATHDVRERPPLPGDRVALATLCHLDRAAGRLESVDPLWPESLDLAPGELALLEGLEPGVAVGDLVARGASAGLPRADAEALVDRLWRRGLILPDRDFQP